MKITYAHETRSGQKQVQIEVVPISIDMLKKYADIDLIRSLCKSGCINYNKKWCCPPYSKPFDIIGESFDEALLICMQMQLSEYSFIGHKYQRIRAANVVLKNLSNKLSRRLEQELEGYALLNGSCNLCKPCNGKLSLPCKKPTLMRFSMESTGINVAALLVECIGFQLQWYKKGLYANV